MVNRRQVHDSDSDSDSDILVYPPTPPRQRTPSPGPQLFDSDTNQSQQDSDEQHALILRRLVSQDLLRVASPRTDTFQFERTAPITENPSTSTGSVNSTASDATTTPANDRRIVLSPRVANAPQVPPEDRLPRHTSLRRVLDRTQPALEEIRPPPRSHTPLPSYSQTQVQPPEYGSTQLVSTQTQSSNQNPLLVNTNVQEPRPQPVQQRQVRIQSPPHTRNTPSINISVNSASDSLTRTQDSSSSRNTVSTTASTRASTRSSATSTNSRTSETGSKMHVHRRRKHSDGSSSRAPRSNTTISDSHSSQRSARSESIRDTPVSEYNPEIHVSTHVIMDIDNFSSLVETLDIPKIFADPRLNVLNQFVREYDHLRNLTRPSLFRRMLNQGSHFTRVYSALVTTVTDVEPPFVVNSSSPASPALILRLFYVTMRSRGKKINNPVVNLPHFRTGKVLTTTRFESVIRSTYLLNDKLRNDYGIASTKSSDL